MKGIKITLCSLCMLFSFGAMANTSDEKTTTDVTTTSMEKNWTCSTNASSSDVEADKDADKKMSTAGSAAENFKMAAEHCRDCTKITCEFDD